MGVIHRIAGRVLPVNPAGEVLLLQGQDPAHPGELHWVSIGGAVDEGESVARAAVRELVEETGLVAPVEALVGPIHRGDYPFSWAGRDYLSDNHFFAMGWRGAAEVDFSGLEPGEVGNILQARWWTPEELTRAGNAAHPDLPEIMTAAIDAVTREGHPA